MGNKILISSKFDSGNIKLSGINENEILLEINKDSNSDFFQWFYFRFQGNKKSEYTFKIINASEASYPPAWNGYNVCASYDRKVWFRVPAEYNGKELIFNHIPEYNNMYFAYFQPYSHERHLDLISQSQQSDLCDVEILGYSVDGRDIELLKISNGDNSDKKKVWIIARQHPGESMAEWFMEGLLQRLLDKNDSISRELLNKTTFYIVPNMNPDGAFRGNLRSNAAGANLNREWMTPSIEKSPEVFYVRNKIHETGVDLFFDIHGDEELPYNFVAGCEGNPSYNEKIEELEKRFIEHFITCNPDFQNTYGYEKDKFGEANLTLAANYIGHTFNCLSLTLEMPFKDNANAPDDSFGWTSEKSKKLGNSFLNPIYYMIK